MKIAFICTGNSVRSQIAEGFAKHLAKEMDKDIEVCSAGSKPVGGVHRLVIEVMKEVGIDISDQYSKGLEEIPVSELDLVITLCGSAKNECPMIP